MNGKSDQPMRIGIIAILHESNTFLDQPTEMKHFEQNILLEGDSLLDAFRGTNHEVGGFIEVLDRSENCVPIGVFAARAMPFGMITSECWDILMAKLKAALDRTPNIDAWLVAPHGATVAENALDADGDWLSRLRQWVGLDTLIVGTLDLHANVSPQMVHSCDALLAYKTNPHLDQRERGSQAASLLLRSLEGAVRPVSVLVQLPMSINIERQATRESHGMLLLDWESEWKRKEPALLDVSFLYGFPYADVQEMGASIIVVTNADRTLAGSVADNLRDRWWEHRELFRGQLTSVQEAVQTVLNGSQGECIGLLDMGDNIGGGGPGDGTHIAHELLRRDATPALVWLCDADSVDQAQTMGVDATANFSLGGKVDERHGPPIVGEFTVRWLGNGTFTEDKARHGGYRHFDQGPTAILTNRQGLTAMIAKQRVAPMSLSQLTSFGLDPRDFRSIVIKGVHAPVAAYEDVCSRLIRVNTPGVTTADDAALTYHRRKTPMFPWELD
jgi:microcystin degradation protein MlrC